MALATLATSLRTLLVDRVAVEENDEVEEDGEDGDKMDGDWDGVQGMGKGEEEEIPELPTLVPRPVGVPEEDWVVYEAFQSVTNQFNEKWRKMWA